jgi:hypothetical protein
MMAVSCVGYFRSKARRAWRNCRRISGREAFGGYNAGDRRFGIMTLWTEPGDSVSFVERWPINLENGETDGSSSSKSRFGRIWVGMKWILADSGRIRRLLRSKS